MEKSDWNIGEKKLCKYFMLNGVGKVGNIQLLSINKNLHLGKMRFAKLGSIFFFWEKTREYLIGYFEQ